MDNARIRQSVVLVIEADTASGARCEALLETLGATPFRVASRQEAEAFLELCTPDAVIVAYELPDGTGIDVVNDYRRRRALRRSPIILLTSEIATNELERAVMAGVFASLGKPFTAHEFFKLITAAIHSDGRHTRRRLADGTRKL